MISTMLARSSHAVVALSGGIDSLIVLQQVRRHAPEIEVLVFKTDFTPHQWEIIDNLIQKWDLTVFSPLPQSSYLIPNGDQLTRVDEYVIGKATVPILRDVVHSDRCLLDLNSKFSGLSPLDFDCVFVGSRMDDKSPATGRPLQRSLTKVDEMWVVAPIYYWTDEQVREAAKDLPYAKEWYEDRDESFDTGNLLACSRCVRGGTKSPVLCPKRGRVIAGHEWPQQEMLDIFRKKFGFSEVN